MIDVPRAPWAPAGLLPDLRRAPGARGRRMIDLSDTARPPQRSVIDLRRARFAQRGSPMDVGDAERAAARWVGDLRRAHYARPRGPPDRRDAGAASGFRSMAKRPADGHDPRRDRSGSRISSAGAVRPASACCHDREIAAFNAARSASSRSSPLIVDHEVQDGAIGELGRLVNQEPTVTNRRAHRHQSSVAGRMDAANVCASTPAGRAYESTLRSTARPSSSQPNSRAPGLPAGGQAPLFACTTGRLTSGCERPRDASHTRGLRLEQRILQ